MKINQAVIIAGGMGTRLKPFTDTAPKPMYPFEGVPFIEYLVKQVKSFGIDRILILLGYLPEKVMEYLGDGSKYGASITYDVTPVENETGKRLLAAKSKMDKEFLFMYCDNYCPISFERLVADYEKNQALIQITAYANRDKYTKDNLLLGEDGKIEKYDKKRITEGLKTVDIGYAIVNREALSLMPEENVNFEAAVYPQLVEQGRMFATVCEHRYYSVGSWERIELTKEFFRDKKFVFLDRDGTLNERAPKACYVEKKEDFVWLPGAREAVKKLNDNGYLVFLVSNQPGLARGNLTEERLSEIHDKMLADLAKDGASIDKIYYCPHNWDDGCFCRKPNPGMLYQAQRDYCLNLSEGVLFGDDERDIDAANRAGVRGVLVTEDYTLLQAVCDLLEQEKNR